MKKINLHNGQYGKFDTAEELLAAYNALEAQFTKRCQLVKELQAELERSAQAERFDAANDGRDEKSPSEIGRTEQIAENFGSDPDGTASDRAAANAECAEQAERSESSEQAASDEACSEKASTVETADTPSGDTGEFDTERQASIDEARQIELAYNAVLNEISSHAAAYAEALSEVPEIMDACIALYKQKRLCGEHLPSPRGSAVLTPVKRPVTLAEAKKLADAILGL